MVSFSSFILVLKSNKKIPGIIHDVVLLGAPVSASPVQWQQISQIVGGRIINGYCNSDWLLRLGFHILNFCYIPLCLSFSAYQIQEIKHNCKFEFFSLFYFL